MSEDYQDDLREELEDELKDRLRETQAMVAALSDDDLEVETRYLGERIEVIRLDIDDYKRDNTPRVASWYRRAGYAQAKLETELRICRAEADRRTQERHAAKMAEQQKARAERIEAAEAARQSRAELFIKHARAILPQDTWRAIWAAVDGEAPAP